MAAEFGVHRPEIEVETDAGVERFGDISGFFYDLDADATAKGWSDEEYEVARARLDALCDTWPEAIWRIEKQPALVPWPKYPDADAKLIPALANELGLVAETIAYERENQNRQAVLKGLEALLVTAAAEEELTAA